uniref:Uncharacterized protein n=1 Tax=Melopsittacus undulatus TaxID=13146 RepID=A0A8V5H7X1_MELUD
MGTLAPSPFPGRRGGRRAETEGQQGLGSSRSAHRFCSHFPLNPNPGPVHICAFCHKALGPREPTVEAMGKQYHAECFTCRTCPRLLAGQPGISWCPPQTQATLEKCAKCQGLITESIVRALGKGFHPDCFSCAACGRAIGAESFLNKTPSLNPSFLSSTLHSKPITCTFRNKEKRTF